MKSHPIVAVRAHLSALVNFCVSGFRVSLASNATLINANIASLITMSVQAGDDHVIGNPVPLKAPYLKGTVPAEQRG
jgi:hypothetical protein